jgi:hypothetical protein
VTKRARRSATFALVLSVGAVGLFGCGGGGGAGSPTPVPSTSLGGAVLPPAVARPTFALPKCDYPTKIPFPSWVPRDLPLPEGTYATRPLPEIQGYNRGLFVVPVGLTALARFVLSEWPKTGWVLGRGDAEQGEIDDQFTKPPAVGAFKAREQYCTPGYSLMLLVYIPDRTKLVIPSPTPSLSPSPSG